MTEVAYIEKVATAMLTNNFERFLERNKIKHCGYDCCPWDGDTMDVKFYFESADHAAMVDRAAAALGEKSASYHDR